MIPMLTRTPYVDRDPFGTRAAIEARKARDSARCVWSLRYSECAWHATLTVTVTSAGSTTRRAQESRSGATESAATYALQSSGAWQTLLAFGITPERIP